MAPAYQLLLRGLDGRTSCLRFPSTVITGSVIQESVSATLHLPADSLLIFTGTALVRPHSSLSADADGFFPSCSVSARLRGGKGGFGSLLRGAATKAGQKKTSNFDACRDMSGRRLRHVNAEKKLKEWKAQAKERELEKAANEFLKKQVKRTEDDSGRSQLIEKFRAETSKAREEVESAVVSGLIEARKLGKRKVEDDDQLLASSSKRAHAWFDSNMDMINYDDEDDDLENATDKSDDEDDDLENAADKSDDENDDDGREVEGKDINDGVGIPEIQEVSDIGRHGKFINCAKQDQDEMRSTYKSPDVLCEEERTEILAEEKLGEDQSDSERTVHAAKTVHMFEVVDTNSLSPRASTPDGIAEQGKVIFQNEQEVSALSHVSNGHAMGLLNAVEQTQKTLELDHFLHASDLEVLGLEQLKHELLIRGLKCGGSLSERAGRLFLLKTIPLEKLDKKHFAKVRG